jgi:site-specific DNA recombinase
VRTIFRRYLELGSISALAEDLDRRGIRTKAVRRLDGNIRGGIRFGVGPLAYMLKNRFYIGEVAYRGEIHLGEHNPILDREVFEAVQAKLAANAVTRKLRLNGSASILTGRIYDDRGNRMSPSHSKKRGVRYRYYVSHALLQNRKQEAGSLARLSAPEIESLILEALRAHLASTGKIEDGSTVPGRDLIEEHIDRVIVGPKATEVRLKSSAERSDGSADRSAADEPTTLRLPRVSSKFAAVKGVVHQPEARHAIDPVTRDALLAAIARSHRWIEDLRCGRAVSLAEIGKEEGLGERHVRLLAPLAFVAPRIVAAIAEGTVPTQLTVTGLARRLPYSWAAQDNICRNATAGSATRE